MGVGNCTSEGLSTSDTTRDTNGERNIEKEEGERR